MPKLEQTLLLPPVDPEPRLVSRETWQDAVATQRGIGSAALSNLLEPLIIRNLPEEYQEFEPDVLDVILELQDPEDRAAMETHIQKIQEDARGEQRPVFSGNPFIPESADKLPPLVDTHAVLMADAKIQEMLDRRDMSEAHARLQEAWPQFNKDYMQGIARGIGMGYVPKSVEDRAKTALDMTSVRIADSAVVDALSDFATLAYYDSTYDEVGVRHDDVSTPEVIGKRLAHEFTHKVSGGTFVHSAGEALVHTRPRAGFATEREQNVYSGTGLNEAMTEHVSLGIITGDFETINPDERQDESKTYYAYRRVLATFVGRSEGVIDMKTLIGAYFEDTGSDGGTEKRRVLVREVKQAYGVGALGKLNKLMDLSEAVDDEYLEEIVLNRIHPPKRDNRGRIVSPGNIDTEGIPTFAEILERYPSKNSEPWTPEDFTAAVASGKKYSE